MLRIIHTSDWHLGRQLYAKSLIDDQRVALFELMKLIERLNPQALLISGDVFDRPLPPEAAVKLFDEFLTEVAGRLKVHVFIIPGNHDSCERLGFASSLLRNQRVTIFSNLEDSFNPVLIKGENESEALVYGIPFVEPFEVARMLKRDDIDTPDEAMKALCKEIHKRRSKDKASILLCHALVAGGETSDSERELFIGGASNVHPEAFSDFSYTALGHLHKPQRAGKENIRYSGSLLPYSKSEIGHKKCVNEIRMHAGGGEIEVIPHHLDQLRQLRYLEGELEAILEKAALDDARDDYVIVGLTDKGAVLDAFAKLSHHYPRLLHVSRVMAQSVSDFEASQARLREREQMSELDLFADFFQNITGTPLDEVERKVIIQVLADLEREESLP